MRVLRVKTGSDSQASPVVVPRYPSSSTGRRSFTRIRDVAELVVEHLEDVREPVEFRFGLVASASGRHRLDLGVRIGELALDGGLLLDAVAVHVHGFENAFRQVLFLRVAERPWPSP